MPNALTNDASRRPALHACPVCDGVQLQFVFPVQTYEAVQCIACGMVFLNPQPSDEELARIYGAYYFLGSNDEAGRRSTALVKRATAELYLSQIGRYHGPGVGRFLEVGCGNGDLLAVAESHGWQVTGVEYSRAACQLARESVRRGEVHCGELEPLRLSAEQFDLCMICDVLEHVRSPKAFLMEIQRLLRPSGTLFVVTPSRDSWSARVLRRNWMEFKVEHLTYFDRKTLQSLLCRTGFRDIKFKPGWKVLTFDYVRKHFERFPVPLITPTLELAARCLPPRVQLRPCKLAGSGMMAFARNHT